MKLNKLLIGILAITAISGCGFTGELTKADGTRVEWKSNRPCVIKEGGFEADGRGEPLLKIGLPDMNANKIGG